MSVRYEHMFDRKYEGVPVGLDAMAPGPVLGAILDSVDVDRVSGHDRVIVLRAQQRMASHFQAQVYAAMTSVAEHIDDAEFVDDAELAWEASATEIRAALRLTRRSAESALDLAIQVRRRLPRVWLALSDGHLDEHRARTIVYNTSHLDEQAARRVVDAVIGDASGLTTGELAARLRRLCVETDPESARERYEEATERRRLVAEASPDGTANIFGLDLPPHRVTAVTRRINRLALSLNTTADRRSIDQLRADVFLDLLSGKHHTAKGGVVDIRVDLQTLAGLAETPGDLAGFGPVVADIARQVTKTQADGEWRFSITDPRTGLTVHDGTTRRRPTASQRRSVEARDRTCIFPGCRMPATQCDLDHRTPWSQTQNTSISGLDPACRYDHITVRHRIGWSHQPLPGGDHLWTSPLGHSYTNSGKPP